LRRCIAFTLCSLLVLGATYLAAACVIFEFVVAFARVPFYFGGIAALAGCDMRYTRLVHRSAETGW